MRTACCFHGPVPGPPSASQPSAYRLNHHHHRLRCRQRSCPKRIHRSRHHNISHTMNFSTSTSAIITNTHHLTTTTHHLGRTLPSSDLSFLLHFNSLTLCVNNFAHVSSAHINIHYTDVSPGAKTFVTNVRINAGSLRCLTSHR